MFVAPALMPVTQSKWISSSSRRTTIADVSAARMPPPSKISAVSVTVLCSWGAPAVVSSPGMAPIYDTARHFGSAQTVWASVRSAMLPNRPVPQGGGVTSTAACRLLSAG
nr:hypothetical protein GCM10023233_16600 [Brevibacterium otitidis]